MNDFAPIVALGSLGYAFVNFLKYLTNRKWDKVVTQLTVWTGGVVLIFFAASTTLVGGFKVNGVAFAAMNAADKLWIGLIAASLFSFGHNAIKAVDNTQSAAVPSLLPGGQVMSEGDGTDFKAIVYKSSVAFRRQKWFFRIVARNGEKVAQSEAYTNRKDAEDIARRLAGTVKVEDGS